MRRWICALLALALLAASDALAEEEFAEFAGGYELSSGVGAWYTEMTVRPDGSFYGHYQDTDMDPGELEGAAYEATIYESDFTGRLSAPKPAGNSELTCKIAELTWEDAGPRVEDGALYVPGEPNGLHKGDALRFFAKGTPAEVLPEEFLVWVRMREGGVRWEALPYNALYNVTADAGFSGISLEAEVWLPIQAQDAGEAKPEWRFLDDATAPTPAPTSKPSGAFIEIADDGDDDDADDYDDDGGEGIDYPVQAEVVNCKTGVSLRERPSTKAALLAEVPLGALVTVYSNEAWYGNERWFVDAAYKGQRGYICVEYLDVLLPEELASRRGYLRGMDGTVSAVNRGSDLILRDGPGTDYDSLGLLFGGEVLGYKGEAKRDSGGTCWYRCSHYGEDCWISAKFTVLTLNDGRTYTGGRGIF